MASEEACRLIEEGSIEAMGRALQAGAATSVALTEAALERIERLDGRLNAFLSTRPDASLAAARASDQRRLDGAALGPFDGTPFAVKDLIDVAGWPTSGGALILSAAPKRADAAVVAKLRAAGGVLIGKTGLHELAYGVTSFNPHFGAVLNPWDLNRSPGGSSGGSAAAVAAAVVPLAIGTDTGCSIRHPAHCCGIVGFKPSHGRVSAAGVTPLVRQLDHVGPMTRSVRDAALAADILSGFDWEDPFSQEFGALGALAAVEAALGSESATGLRLGRLRGDGFDEGDRETLALIAAAIEVLQERLGAIVVDVEPPGLFALRRAAGALFAGDPSAEHGLAVRRSPQLIGEDVRRKLEHGLRVGAGALAAAQEEVRRFKRRMAETQAAAGVSVLLAPTCGAPAPPQGPAEHPWADLATVNCSPFNATGQPSISIPCGLTREGLPVGLMLSGAVGADAALLGVAAQAERALAEAGLWTGQRPPF